MHVSKYQMNSYFCNSIYHLNTIFKAHKHCEAEAAKRDEQPADIKNDHDILGSHFNILIVSRAFENVDHLNRYIIARNVLVLIIITTFDYSF